MVVFEASIPESRVSTAAALFCICLMLLLLLLDKRKRRLDDDDWILQAGATIFLPSTVKKGRLHYKTHVFS